ncbi:hypothetical protein D3C86_2093200 [compost metagenome]
MGQIIGLMHHPKGGEQDGGKDDAKRYDGRDGIDGGMQPRWAADQKNDDRDPRDEQLQKT